MNCKMPKRVVSNQEFERAYRGTPGDPASIKAAADNRHILRAVAGYFRDSLGSDDLRSCELRALWRALQSHDPSHGQKFTSSLYRFAAWECRQEIRYQQDKPRLKRVRFPGSEAAVASYRAKQRRAAYLEEILEYLEALPVPWQRQILLQRYLEGMTMTEIGEANGYSKETARQKIGQALSELRGVCS